MICRIYWRAAEVKMETMQFKIQFANNNSIVA